GNTWIEYACVPVQPIESVTCTVKLALPVVVGVPAMAPDESPSVSPAGSAPAVSVKTNGGVPALGASVTTYAAPTWPAPSDPGEVSAMAGHDGSTTTEYAW